MNILEIQDVSAWYGNSRVLHGISLSLPAGGATAVLGANGAGKTTTLRAISGMVRFKGHVRFDGKLLNGLGTDQIARLGIAHVPQGRGSLTNLSVRDNLMVGAYARKDRKAISKDFDYCIQLFPQLERRIRSQAAMLSGGEQQMLAIGRAIMSRPQLLLLDEPSLGLAPSTAQLVYRAIEQLRTEVELSLVIVEENAALAFSLAESATVLEAGSVALAGPRSELVQLEAVRKAYLGG